MTMTELEIKKMADDDFIRFISTSSGLSWWMKTAEKNIVFLNDPEGGHEAPAVDIRTLLRDLVWAQQVVVEEDFFRFKFFIQSMRQGKEAAAIFRLRDNQGRRLWWRIAGAPGVKKTSCYYGYIEDITGNVSFINHLLEKDMARQTMIETDEHPVVLVDMDTRAIISQNTLAYKLLGYTSHEFNRLNFQDLYPPGPGQVSRAAKIYETCLLEGHWQGKFKLVKKGDIVIEARVKIKRLSLRDRNLLRLVIYETLEKDRAVKEKPGGQLPDREEFKQTLMNAMENKEQITGVLDTLLNHQYNGALFEAVLYADIYIKKGIVNVYGRGDAFKTLKPGTSYNYEGTISQMVWEKQLDYVILDDTLESTRPIDWVLFIPYGIRSYFAKPFFHGDKLRTLLILCSTEPNRFSEGDLEKYEVYSPAFLKGLRNWRKAKR